MGFIAGMTMGSVNRQSRKLLWATCLCLQLAACGALAETSVHITQQELVAQLESGTAPLILDVRTAEEYETGHIPGAINIHFREIEERIDEITQNGPVVVYCERGIRANIAARTLQAAGITPILYLDGDISLWRKHGLPLEPAGVSPATVDVAKAVAGNTTPELAASLEQRWVVSAAEAKQLITQGATILDTRKLALKSLQGAIYADWQQFSPKETASRGNLLASADLLTQRLQTMGISKQTPVVVFANPPGGWGEDGRIVWMLRTLGHSQAVLVDGGFEALVKAGVPVQSRQKKFAKTPKNPKNPKQGDFVVRYNPTWEIHQDALKAALGQDNLVVIDTREAREFAGKTPYGEQRGGHVPGAINLYFKEFLGQDGQLLPADTIRTMLENAGITPDTEVVVYCTGGIRSGWLAAVLITLGYDVKNYAGSMWEWSAGPADSYPLEML